MRTNTIEVIFNLIHILTYLVIIAFMASALNNTGFFESLEFQVVNTYYRYFQ